jgi:hypothetical protein
MSHFPIFVTICFLSCAAIGQEGSPDHSGEIYALASVSNGPETGSQPAAGFAVGCTWEPTPKFGLVADFGRHFVSDNHASFNTFTAGLRRYSQEQYRLSGFLQVLAGSEQAVVAGQPTHWNFVLAPGAGGDIRLTDKLVWRAIQVDVTITRGSGSVRASSGFVFRFGH